MEFTMGVRVPVRVRVGIAEVRRLGGRRREEKRCHHRKAVRQRGKDRWKAKKKIKSKESIIPNKTSSHSNPRQAHVFKALQKPVLCGSLFAEEAWLEAPAGEEQMVRLQASL